MKFEVSINMDSCCTQSWNDEPEFSDERFLEQIIHGVCENISDRIFDDVYDRLKSQLGSSSFDVRNELRNQINKSVREEIPSIKQQIIDNALRKRDLRELCTTDTANRKYIEEVVNDCLKKKLGG